ncbi:unnamed protein product [Polarella glacialis]|uniref:J domain-containing protein n=1 Tax=Polarella glacialis TaxID=89957 RepID=A0A813GKE8_POLGL|nr:unnamed protein product [Polarella glacialis]
MNGEMSFSQRLPKRCLTRSSQTSGSPLFYRYKKLALRVHPDKVRNCDLADAKAAFARLEAASRVVEVMVESNCEACRQLHRVLRCDPFTVKGASGVLKDSGQCCSDCDVHQLTVACSSLQ